MTPVNLTSHHKHLDVYFSKKINFDEHINIKIGKAKKGIIVVKNLQ